MRRTKTMMMGELLDEFFKRPYVAAKVAEGRLPDTWREIVGERAAADTTELRLERHILHVRIRSSVLRQELFYQREALKEEINRRSGVPSSSDSDLRHRIHNGPPQQHKKSRTLSDPASLFARRSGAPSGTAFTDMAT